MFLTKSCIHNAVNLGDITIEPFNPNHLSPNSYDVTLHNTLLVYKNFPLDMKLEAETESILIPEEGLVLEPNVLYIGSTNETATSHKYVPMFEGRSSIGRLGINTHITAGFGDIGWGYTKDNNGVLHCHKPTWTLEIAVIHPVRIYPNVRIGQVYFVEPKGEVTLYSGKYSKQIGPQSSLSHLDY